MQTTPKANNILGHFFALLGAVGMLAIATWVSASSSEQVKPIDNLTTPRTGHTATALSDGRILITGGRDADGHLVAASEIFDPETQTTSASAELHTARVDHSATLLANGRVLVIGGTGASGALSSAEIFDPAHPENGFVTVGSAMSTARTRHTATLLNDGHVLIAGGDAQGTAELFDPSTGTFMPTIWPLTVARSGHTATLFTDDSVLLAGGNTATMETYVPNQGFTLDPATMSVVRTGHWAFELSDTRLLLFQGDTGNTIDEFNPSSGTITPKGSLDFHASSSSLLANGKVLVLGTDVSGLYNPDAVPPAPDFTAFDEESVPHSGVLPRSGQAAAELPGDKKILISGGVDGDNHLLGQALFNPARIWTDMDNYVPGEPVVLYGSGWKAHEDVYLFAVDNINQQWTWGATVTVGADGAFVEDPAFIVQLIQQGAQFHVTAVGQSTMQADVFFTDAPRIGAVTVGAQSGTLTYGTAASATFSVSTTRIGNGTVNGTFSVISGLPAGATASFVPATFTANGGNPFPNSTLTVSTTASAAAGVYPITVRCADGTDISTGGAATLTINKATPTVVVTPYTCPTTTYTGLPHTATVASITGVNGETGATVGTVNVSNTTHTNAGTYFSDTWSFTGTANYNNIAATTITDCIAKANATVVVTPYTCPSTVYNGLPHTATVTSITGVNGETGATVGTVNVSNTTHTNAGTYSSDTWTFTGTANYNNIAATTITDCIDKANATVVVTPYTCPGTIYDGLSHTAAITSITGVNGESGATVGTVDVSNTTHIMAGMYSSDTWSFTGTANYNNIAATTITDCIARKDATWTTNPASKTYGDADPSPLTTGSGSDFTATDAALVTVTYSRVAGENASPPTYHITATLGPADVIANYNITNNGAEFTINKRAATWTTNPASKTYGDADPSPLTTGSGSNFTDPVTATYSRVTGENASPPTYHINATLNAAAGVLNNYIITNDGAEFTINKRNATWTTNPASKTYGDLDPTPLTTGSGSNFVAADGVTATYGRVAGENASPPTYHITATLSATVVGALNNYNITNAGAEFTISKRDATWTTNPGSKTYGDLDPSPLTTGNGSGFVAGDGVTASYSRVAGENASPPTYHITATLSATVAGALNNYNVTNTGAEFTINKRDATWTTNSASKTYGDGDPSPLTTGSGSGFVAGDGVTASYSRVAGENASPPTYHITATLSATVAGALANYNITNTGAELTINKRDATWTTNPASKTYGNADPAPLTTGSGSNFVAADGVTATYSRVAGENASPPTYHITAALSATVPGALANYNITNAGAEFTIDKRDATWTTNPASKTYGDADPSPLTTGSGSNFVAADGVTASYSRVAGENASPPTYHITATLSATAAGALNNYNITNAGAEFTIDKRDATWTTNPASKTYGDADPAPLTTGSGSNFVAADGVTATYGRVAGENASPPTYHITATLSATVAGALANYNITNAGAEFTINKRDATWTTDPNNKIYGDADPAPLTTGSGSNFVAADGVTATYSRVAGENASPPTYHITAALSATVAGALANYNVTNVGAEFTILKRVVIWTTNPGSKTYGDADPAPLTTGNGANFVAADNVTATYARVAGENASPPTYHITATLHATPASALDNYIITNAGAEFTINKRLATWTTDPNNKTYGDADPSPLTTGSGSNFIAADNVTATYGRVAGENASPPTYHITATLHATPASALDNYIITNAGAEFTINKRVATWTTNPASKTYGDDDPSPLTTGSGSNFVAADIVTATYGRVAGENASPPTYHISATLHATPASALDNYIIANDGAEFTINKRAATWTTNPASKTYGDLDPNPLTTGSGSNFVPADGVTASYSRVAGENASPPTYHITATLSATVVGALDNYIITNAGAEFTINKRAATWTTNPASKTYGDLDPNPLTTGSGSNFVPADGVTASYSRVAGENASPPTYHITATLSATVVGALDNYIITNAGAEFTINKRAATWTSDPNSKTYGDLDPSPLTTGSGSNFVPADGVTASYSRVAGENASPPTYHITATLSATVVGALDNYIITNAGAEFTINKRLATWTTDPNSKTYGDLDPSPLTTGSGSNFVPADGVTASYSRVAGENASPPTYHITATLSATVVGALDNYIITNAGAEFTINKRAATWTTNPASKTYGDLDPSPLTTGSGSNFVPADGVTASYSRVTGENASPPSYHITATLSATVVGALDNYVITNTGAEFTINKRVATWTTDPNSKTYGNDDPAPLTTGTGTNFVAADNVTATYGRVAGENASPPTYHITATLSATPMSALDNYIIVNDGAEFTINKRSATWTTNPNSKTYGSLDPVPLSTGSGSNFVPADSVTATYSRPSGETVLGGPYQITATLSATPMSALNNYNITNNGANFTINPKDLDVMANNRTKTYGLAVTFAGTEFTVGVGQLVTGDSVTSVTLTSAGAAAIATFTAPGPDYNIVPSAAVGPGLDNYIIHYSNGTLHVNQATLTITAASVTKTYGNTYTPDATTPSTDFSVSGLVNSDTVASVALSSTGYPPNATYTSPGPTYTITVGSASGTGLGNYIISYTPATLTITQASLTVAANNVSKVYGNTYTFDTTTPSTDFSVTGLKNSDNVASVTLSSAGAAAGATFVSPGPTYPITVGGASGTGLGNYTISYTPAILTISQATLTITATNRSKAFAATYTPDTTPPSPDLNITGLVNSDTVTNVTLTCPGYAAAALPQATPYVVTPSAAVGTGLGNYNIGYVNGQFTVGFGNCAGGGVIQQPINADGTSVFPHAGRTVPVKFYVCDASGNHISDPNVVFAGTGGQLTMLSQVRSQIQTVDEGTYNDVPDAAFRWSPGDNIWIWNMTTNNLQSGNKYTFHINLRNGTYIEFFIAIK